MTNEEEVNVNIQYTPLTSQSKPETTESLIGNIDSFDIIIIDACEKEV